MKDNNDIPQAVRKLAELRNLHDVEYIGQWKHYSVYYIWNKSTVKRYCGIPMHALVDTEGMQDMPQLKRILI